jgi:dTDP-4-dehydrorhamnose reductase
VSNMPCVWITGAGGLIGSHLVRCPSGAPISNRLSGFTPPTDQPPDSPSTWQVHALTRNQLDLCDFPAVERAFRAEHPDLVIHCAALTQSPLCQSEPEQAWRINVQATKHLAQLAEAIPFVFFSTDLVFDGQRGSYNESAPPNPLSIYAETKLAAELVVLANPRHTVVRTSLNAGHSPTLDRGLDEQLRVAWERHQKTRLFTDEFRSPIPASVTARAVWEIANQGRTGLYHVAGAQRLSRWEIGQLVAARYPHLKPQIEPASLKDYAGPPRPPDTTLDCRKIQEVLSFRLPAFGEWLAEHADV